MEEPIFTNIINKIMYEAIDCSPDPEDGVVASSEENILLVSLTVDENEYIVNGVGQEDMMGKTKGEYFLYASNVVHNGKQYDIYKKSLG